MMRKIFAFIFLILLAFTLVCGIKYYSWQNQLGFIESDDVKLELIKFKIETSIDANFSVPSYWYDNIMNSQQASKTFSQKEKIDYFSGILYFLQEEMSRSGEATMLFFMKISQDDMKALYIKLLQLEKTKYYNKLSEEKKAMLNVDKQSILYYSENGIEM